MPIEIRELIVKATVSSGSRTNSTTTGSADNSSVSSADMQKTEIIDQMNNIIKRQKER